MHYDKQKIIERKNNTLIMRGILEVGIKTGGPDSQQNRLFLFEAFC
jgi:hypothetical protein